MNRTDQREPTPPPPYPKAKRLRPRGLPRGVIHYLRAQPIQIVIPRSPPPDTPVRL